MELRKVFIGIAVGALFLLSAQVSFAFNYSGAWTLDDETADDFFVIDINFIPGTGSFYMYDFGYPGSNLLLLNDSQNQMQTVNVTQPSGSNWQAQLAGGGTTLDLGDTQPFGFYFYDGTNKYTTYSVTQTGSDTFRLENINTGMEVIVSDVAIPIPGAVWLLGSCMIGLLGIKRRIRR